MNNKKLFTITTLVVFITSAAPAYALTIDEIMPRGENARVLGVSTTSLLGQIEEAKQMLAGERLNYVISPVYANKKVTIGTGKNKKTTTKQVVSGYTTSPKDIALAILDPGTNEIKIAKAMQRDTNFEFPDKNFDIEKISFNGVNTSFRVNNPSNGTVLALKYLISKDGGTKKAVQDSMYEGVYVPYTAKLSTPEVAKEGDNYLTSVITQATNQLANVRSSSHPEKLIVEAIPPAAVKALIYAEHVSMWEYQNIPRQELINKVNTLFGANKADTYKYSVSSAGASGLAQFMPNTYASLVKRRTDIALNSDFINGMRDHVNAVKAMYGLLDDYLGAVKTLANQHFIPGHAIEYAAAAYNGGPVRVAGAAKAFGPGWSEYKASNEKSLRAETASYVTKIQGFLQWLNSQPASI